MPPFCGCRRRSNGYIHRHTGETRFRGGHDGLVALGGGSAMDTAKAGAIVATSGEELRALKVPRIVDFAVMPVIAIPTTAGTGSEVTRAAVVTDTAASEKCSSSALPLCPLRPSSITS